MCSRKKESMLWKRLPFFRSQANRTRKLIEERESDKEFWSNSGNLAPSWDDRAKKVGEMIGAAPHSVLDMGAGSMALADFLAPGSEYTPCDIVKRGDRYLVADLNRYEFPTGNFDYVCFLGVLEYIHDVKWCLQRSRAAAGNLIVTYCTNLSADVSHRRECRWVNDFSKAEFEALLQEFNWRIEKCEPYKKNLLNAQFIWKCRAD
jgi:hypothetical protein